jgi:tetratricopeptide (TPR) repeat protein
LWLAIGNIYDEQGNKTKAEEAFVKALEVDPNYSDGVIRYGSSSMRPATSMAPSRFWKKALSYTRQRALSDRLAASYFRPPDLRGHHQI